MLEAPAISYEPTFRFVTSLLVVAPYLFPLIHKLIESVVFKLHDLHGPFEIRSNHVPSVVHPRVHLAHLQLQQTQSPFCPDQPDSKSSNVTSIHELGASFAVSKWQKANHFHHPADLLSSYLLLFSGDWS